MHRSEGGGFVGKNATKECFDTMLLNNTNLKNYGSRTGRQWMRREVDIAGTQKSESWMKIILVVDAWW